MGCQCTKKTEKSNMNLQDSIEGVPEISMSNSNLNYTVN
jgi:hypothetical protein